MRQQSYLVRKGARYHFRRRIPHSLTARPISISLGTADPDKARCLARRLAVKWDELAMGMEILGGRRTLSLDEQEALFRKGLKDELARATVHITAPIEDEQPHPLHHKMMAMAYRVMMRMPADAEELDQAIVDQIVPESWSASERALLDKVMRLMVSPRSISTDETEAALQTIDAPVNETTVRDARLHIFRGFVEAQQRAELIQHPLIEAAGNPISALLDDGLVLEARRSKGDEDGNRFFARTTDVRFSEQIDELVDKVFADNEWQPDGNRTRHMFEAFAWLTGDKPMADYEPEDIKVFARRMARIPRGFKWGRLGVSDGMAVPFQPENFPELPANERRSNRTINSYLTKLQAAAKVLHTSYWLPKQGDDQVMKFNGSRKKVIDDPTDPDRVPLTEENLRTLYSLPIWQGSGGALKRLHVVDTPVIYQDAAYWVPLLGTYEGMSREEACGLELIDVEVDVETPYVLVRENMTKTKDGVTPAGIKRRSRRRALPIHSELLRLGFASYVKSVEAEGWDCLFPELYGHVDENGTYMRRGKPGGPWFYARAWRGMIDASHVILPLPMTSAGKHADFHSQRTFHYSAMAGEEVSEALLARHIGHSARTTGGRKYNRRALALGEARELAERRKVLEREVPIVTDHVPAPGSVNLLHLNHRSRVGSAEGRDALLYFLWDEEAIAADKRRKAELRKAAKAKK